MTRLAILAAVGLALVLARWWRACPFATACPLRAWHTTSEPVWHWPEPEDGFDGIPVDTYPASLAGWWG